MEIMLPFFRVCRFFDRYIREIGIRNFASRKARTSASIFLIGSLFLCQATSASETDFPYKKCFENSAEEVGLDSNFLAAVASVESSFNPLAESTSGALGLMQIKWPQTALELGITERSELFDPCKNIQAGAQYLANLSARFNSKLLSLAAYHEGPTKIGRENSIPKQSVIYIEKVLREEFLIQASNELKKKGNCDLLDLQSLTQKTHHPIAKLNVASDWFRQSHIFCSTPKLLDLRNQLPEIMGTADARGELLQLVNNALQKKSETKNKAGVLPPALPSS